MPLKILKEYFYIQSYYFILCLFQSLKIRMDGMETNLYNASISFGGKEKEQRDVPTYIIEDIEDLKF